MSLARDVLSERHPIPGRSPVRQMLILQTNLKLVRPAATLSDQFRSFYDIGANLSVPGSSSIACSCHSRGSSPGRGMCCVSGCSNVSKGSCGSRVAVVVVIVVAVVYLQQRAAEGAR